MKTEKELVDSINKMYENSGTWGGRFLEVDDDRRVLLGLIETLLEEDKRLKSFIHNPFWWCKKAEKRFHRLGIGRHRLSCSGIHVSYEVC